MQTVDARSEQEQLARGIDQTRSRLLDEFQDRVHSEVIERTVSETFETLKGASVSEFVPLFVYRTAREHLSSLASGG